MKQTVGLIVGIAAAAFATWWMMRRQTGARQESSRRDRGVVIYDNTPTATEAEAIP